MEEQLEVVEKRGRAEGEEVKGFYRGMKHE
jgi:hypothetical protein